MDEKELVQTLSSRVVEFLDAKWTTEKNVHSYSKDNFSANITVKDTDFVIEIKYLDYKALIFAGSFGKTTNVLFNNRFYCKLPLKQEWLFRLMKKIEIPKTQ